MEKKIHLKPWAQKTLEVITAFQFILAASIDDFEWRGLPFIILHWVIMLFNIYILDEYGRDGNGFMR